MSARLALARGAAAITVALAAMQAVGCEAREAPPQESAPAFAAEPQSANGNVFLRARAQDGLVAVDVVANRTPEIHGAALRLTWDPGALAFDRMIPGASWSPSALALAKEGTPGQLAVAWTETAGERSFDATYDTVLGTLVFRRIGPGSTALAFRRERSRLVDRRGAPVVVSWHGGTVLASREP